MTQRPRLYEVVALARDLPERGLFAGVAGTVLEIYEPDGVEVEFLGKDGEHLAVLTLHDTDVRRRHDDGPDSAAHSPDHA
jgi:hypothetical protein